MKLLVTTILVFSGAVLASMSPQECIQKCSISQVGSCMNLGNAARGITRPLIDIFELSHDATGGYLRNCGQRLTLDGEQLKVVGSSCRVYTKFGDSTWGVTVPKLITGKIQNAGNIIGISGVYFTSGKPNFYIETPSKAVGGEIDFLIPYVQDHEYYLTWHAGDQCYSIRLNNW